MISICNVMDFKSQFKTNIFNINPINFEKICLEVYQYQYSQNVVYQEFVNNYFGINYSPKNIYSIPFLPIQFFKSHLVVSGDFSLQKVFESSGTTGSITSKHHIKDTIFYDNVALNIFESKFGQIQDSVILPLLPSYSERNNSSLVHMVSHLMNQTGQQTKKYYLSDFKELINDIKHYYALNKIVIVFGVSFALLDWADSFEKFETPFTIIETGGMKGRKKEMVREEVHFLIQQKFPNAKICSEYGMTELLSQGYAMDGHIFETPLWMKGLIRDTTDPKNVSQNLKKGGLNVIDLANIDSVSFIETQDLAESVTENTFKITGRFDHSEVRGCNLLYA